MAKGDLQYNVGVNVDLAEINKFIQELKAGGPEVARGLNAALGGTVTKQVVIEARTDASGAKQLVAVEKERLSVADAVINRLNQIQKIERGSVTSLRQQVNEAKQARDQLAKYEQGIGPLGGKVQRVTDQWADQNVKVRTLQRQLDLAEASGFWDRAKTSLNVGGLASFANGLTQITNGLQSASIVVGQIFGSINQLTNALAGLQQFDLAFEAVGAGASGSAQALNESSRIALGLGVNLATVRQGFQQLTPVVLNSGGTIGDVSKITESLSSRFAAFGISGDKARRVMNGVIQAFAKGKLQAEELTQQISEADPAFKTDFAQAVGVSVAELEGMVKAGEVTSEMLLDVIPRLGKSGLLFGRLGTSAADAVDGLEKNSVTIDQVRNKFDGLNQLSLEAFAKQFEPIIVSLLDVQASVIDFVSNLSKLSIVQSFATIFAGFSSVIGGLVSSVLKLAETFLTIVSAVTSFINPLLEIPGVAQTIGVVILSRLIAPLLQLKQSLSAVAGPAITKGISDVGKSFAQAAGAGSGFAQTLAKLNTYQGLASIFKGSSEARKQFGDLSREGQALGGVVSSISGKMSELQSKLDAAKARLSNTSGLMQKLGVSTSPAERQVAALTRSISKLEGLLGGYEGRLQEVNSAKALLRTTLLNTGAATGFFSKALALGTGLIRGLSLALKEVIVTLGPIGALIAAVGVVFAAFNNGNKETSRIAEESRGRLDALGKSIESLKGFTQESTKPAQGLALAWERFSLAIAQAGDGIGGSEEKTKELGGALPPVVQSLGQFSATAAAGAGIGAVLGGVLGTLGLGFGAIPGAVAGAQIGTFVGSLVGLASTGDGTAVSLAKLERVLVKGTSAAQAESQAIVDLAGSLQKAEVRIQSNTKKLDDLIKKRNELKATGRAGSEVTQVDRQIAQTKVEIQIDSTKAIAGLNTARDALTQLKAQIDAIANRKGVLQDAIATEEAKGPEANAQALSILRKELALVSAESLKQDIALSQAESAVDKYAKATGRLTEAQRALAPTIANLENDIKALQANFASDVDPFSAGGDQAANKIQALAAVRDAASQSSAQLQRFLLQDSLQTELNNIQQVRSARVQALNDELARIRENSSARIEALKELTPAEQELEAIERRKLELRASAGDIEAQAQLDRLNRNREIAQIEKETAAQEKQVRAQIAAEEKAAREENLSIQRQLLELANQEKQAKIDAAKAVLEERNQATGGIRAANEASKPLLNNISQVAIKTREMRDAASEASTKTKEQADNSGVVRQNVSDTQAPMSGLADSAAKFNTQVKEAVTRLESIDGKTINVKIQGTPARWAGGPVSAGTSYQVNELGQEGFLSSGGHLSAINKPKNALWRAPSSGTVIPAHVWSGIDAPKGGVQVNSGSIPGASNTGNLKDLARSLQFAVMASQDNSELANVQVQQALEIGKLGRAVDKLASKKWNVQVGVTNTGSTAYLNALNSRL